MTKITDFLTEYTTGTLTATNLTAHITEQTPVDNINALELMTQNMHPTTADDKMICIDVLTAVNKNAASSGIYVYQEEIKKVTNICVGRLIQEFGMQLDSFKSLTEVYNKADAAAKYSIENSL